MPWVNPSPNLRTMTAAVLYPGLGFLDYSPVSVGRGTDTPFELFGAAWMNGGGGGGGVECAAYSGGEFCGDDYECGGELRIIIRFMGRRLRRCGLR